MMKSLVRPLSLLTLLFAATLLTGGCSSIYYKTMETLGYHKRDLLVENVEEARDAQTEAKEQFQSALEQFTSVVNFDGGELQEKYDRLNAEFERSESKAKAVSDRIGDVESVAEALFSEWESELEEYSSGSGRRRSSERMLNQTRDRYGKLINAMKRAETKIEPVLSAFRDEVLFLKHNLNAKAIASLRDELVTIETDVASLVKEMEASVAEANAFIEENSAEEAT